jgi:hypothetical protein
MTAVARRQLSSNSGRPVAWRTLTARAGHVGQDVGDDGGCLGWQDKSAWEKTQRWERENGSDSSLVRILDCKRPKHQESKRNHVTLYSSASISPHLTSVAKCMQPKQKTAHPCQPSTPAAQPTQSLPTRYRRNTTCHIPALPCQVL